MSDWNETKSILLEIEQLYSRDEDIRDINDINKMMIEIENERNGLIIDFRDLLRQYTSKVTHKEQEVLAPSAVTHNKTIEKLNQEKENLIVTSNKSSKLIDTELESISKLVSKSLQIQQSTNTGIEDANLESRTSYSLSLYSKISNISWDYSSTPGHLAGCYADEMKKEMYNFDFEINDISAFDLANALWDLIGENMPYIDEVSTTV